MLNTLSRRRGGLQPLVWVPKRIMRLPMKLLIATDLHYIPNLADEMAVNAARIPASTFNHEIEGKLYWHNQMMVECGDQLIDGLERIARAESPELFIFL